VVFKPPNVFFSWGDSPKKWGDRKLTKQTNSRRLIEKNLETGCFLGRLLGAFGEIPQLFKRHGEHQSRATYGLKAFLPKFPMFFRHEVSIDIFKSIGRGGSISTTDPA